MDSQSSHGAQRVTAGDHGAQGTQSAPGALPIGAPFRWTERDTNKAFSVELALDFTARGELAKMVRESTVELRVGARAPSLMDAWRFFQAGRELEESRDHALHDWDVITRARGIGARIAFAVTGWPVVDVVFVNFGSLGSYIASCRGGVFLCERDGTFSEYIELTDAGREYYGWPKSDATGTP